jgi:hypothetical protein
MTTNVFVMLCGKHFCERERGHAPPHRNAYWEWVDGREFQARGLPGNVLTTKVKS